MNLFGKKKTAGGSQGHGASTSVSSMSPRTREATVLEAYTKLQEHLITLDKKDKHIQAKINTMLLEAKQRAQANDKPGENNDSGTTITCDVSR